MQCSLIRREDSAAYDERADIFGRGLFRHVLSRFGGCTARLDEVVRDSGVRGSPSRDFTSPVSSCSPKLAFSRSAKPKSGRMPKGRFLSGTKTVKRRTSSTVVPRRMSNLAKKTTACPGARNAGTALPVEKIFDLGLRPQNPSKVRGGRQHRVAFDTIPASRSGRTDRALADSSKRRDPAAATPVPPPTVSSKMPTHSPRIGNTIIPLVPAAVESSQLEARRPHRSTVVPSVYISRAEGMRRESLAGGFGAEGPAVRPAQGTALGNGNQQVRSIGPTGQRFDERLARWADNVVLLHHRYPGRCPGLGESCSFGASVTSPANLAAPRSRARPSDTAILPRVEET